MKIAMIPCRYGSTRAKLKNLAMIGDKPMMAWAINAAKESKIFDRIIVNGDNPIFNKVADEYGVEYYNRPSELGESEALIDDVLLNFSMNYESDILSIVNTINPLQTGQELKEIISFFEENNLDSCNTYEEKYIHGFFGDDPINFEFGKMCRTQDLIPIKLLSYSMQVVRTKTFQKYKNIFCGNFKLYGPISKTASMIVKTPEDIKNINCYLNNKNTKIEYYN